MSRVVARLVLPTDLDDLIRVAAGLARAYPGAVIGDSEDPRVLVVEDPYADDDQILGAATRTPLREAA